MAGRELKLREILHQQITDDTSSSPPGDNSSHKNDNFEFTLRAAAVANEKETDYANLDIFHRAVYPIMLLAQCFAIMPLTGVWETNPKRIRFAFKSIQMIYTISFMIVSSILTLGTLKHLLKIGVNAKNFVGLVFFACVQSACIIFIDLARRWPPVIRYWTRTEMVFTRPPYEIPKTNLARRIRLAALIIIAMSVFEHGFYLTSAIVSYRKRKHICALTQNRTTNFIVNFDDYMEENYSYVFQILPYSPFIAIYVLITNGICTFIWNYMDLFIMMVSKGLAYRFEQISSRIRKLETEDIIPEATFIQIREHYVKMCEILERVDNIMSSLILLSCVNNLYFVCYQLLNVFNKLRWPINYIYFWYSLLYLIGRCAFVFLTAAAINDESKSALGILRRVSTRSWCVEVERLIFQMTTQTVALSGKKFYFLTRRLLFGMAGTIVTYELVLLQFDEPNRRKGLLPLLLFISQIFGLLPVANIRALDVTDIEFRWLNPHIIYSAIVVILNLCEFGAVLNFVSKVAINFHNSSTLSLYIVCLLEHFFFWRLAIKWPNIMRKWQRVEQLFLNIPYRFYDEYKIKKRIYIVFGIVMSSALVEHCLLLLNSFHLSNMERIQCKINVTYFESIYKWERPHLYMILPYHFWLLPILEWINLTIAYPRSFTDCFIMCIGIGLASRFHQLHRRIAAVHHKIMPGIFWTEIREHYLALKRLVRLLDGAIAPLVLLAFGNNMSFICFQLFNSFKNIGLDFIVMVAFWYSLVFAILRTMLTIFVASSINDFERKIAFALRDVPAKAWSIEVQRFSEQLGNDMTALSGSGFFLLTRQLVLTMGTTIITYELMISDVINQSAIRQRTQYCREY